MNCVGILKFEQDQLVFLKCTCTQAQKNALMFLITYENAVISPRYDQVPCFYTCDSHDQNSPPVKSYY